MDFWFVAVFALLLGHLDSIKTSKDADISPQNSSTTTTITMTTASTTMTSPAPVPMSSTLRLGFLAVRWSSDCEGPVLFTQTQTNESEFVCFSSRFSVVRLLRGVCEQKKGCRGKETLEMGQEKANARQILENDVSETQCETLRVRCEVERPLKEPQEPVRFRVATILLSLALVFLLLFCFSKPTVKVLQKRLSNKRKNRWIGPTQSHSVSYHRGQTVNKNMHSSYPALDQLVVGNREPSSNRNSYNI